jgi:uncharacterized protein
MKAQRRDEMAALRSLIAAIDNAESVEESPPAPGASRETGGHIAGARHGLGAADSERRSLSGRELQRIIEAELWERDAQADRFERLGRVDDTARLRREAKVIARYHAPAG